MIEVLKNTNFDNVDLFVKSLNNERIIAGKKWIFYKGTVNNKNVLIKTYGTGYLQTLTIDDIKHPAPMDMNVTQWKESIKNALEYQK